MQMGTTVRQSLWKSTHKKKERKEQKNLIDRREKQIMSLALESGGQSNDIDYVQ